MAASGHARTLGEERRAVSNWAEDGYQEHPGLLHQHVKNDRLVHDELCNIAETEAQPDRIMDIRAEKWDALWQDQTASLQDIKLQLERTLAVA